MKNLKKSKFKYLWKAVFSNRVVIQHPEDKYSKHDPEAEHNPSSFRDFQDWFDKYPDRLEKFMLYGERDKFIVDLNGDRPIIYAISYTRNGDEKLLVMSREKRNLTNIRIIYYRNMECEVINGELGEPKVKSYCLGYQGIDKNGNSRKNIITVL